MADDFFRKRLLDLSARAARTCRYTYTAFLTEAERAEAEAARGEIGSTGMSFWGGREDAERVVCRFGDADAFGYDEPFPIETLRISPLHPKYAEALTHRDILGAVTHTGISRGEIGDILVGKEESYFFCKTEIAPYLIDNLLKIRHTDVRCEPAEEIPPENFERRESGRATASSERADGLVAKVFGLSRGECLKLFAAQKVFVNGACVTRADLILKENDRVSVRGFGKFRYLGQDGKTRKGNLVLLYEKYI